MMNILYVVPYVPNLVRVRPFNLIRSLSALGHRVTVFTLWTDESERADVAALREICHAVYALPMPTWRSMWNCMLALPSSDPLQSVYSWRPDLLSSVNGAAEFDLIHVEHLRGARYALYLKEHTALPVVWDSVDCITHLFRQAATSSKDRLRRWRSRFELGRTARYEGELVSAFDRVLVTSPTDKAKLADLSQTTAPIEVIPNGVALDYFRPDPAAAREPATLVISGKMSYHANITMVLHLVEKIMPYVWEARPDTRLQVVGKDPVRDIQDLGQHPAITVTGTVPDLPPYLQRATVAVAPITYKAGIQNKILEAMATATPVVTTPAAVSALQVKPNQDLMVAATPQAFAEAILSLLGDEERRRTMGKAARRFVETHHDWRAIAGRLTAVYKDVISRPTPSLAK